MSTVPTVLAVLGGIGVAITIVIVVASAAAMVWDAIGWRTARKEVAQTLDHLHDRDRRQHIAQCENGVHAAPPFNWSEIDLIDKLEAILALPASTEADD